jgi:hypothetical protein
VTRARYEWSAAEGADRSTLYTRYACALVEEERAAAQLEHAVEGDAETPDAGDPFSTGTGRLSTDGSQR